MTNTTFTRHLRDVLDGVDVILSDIWGVVHNGLEASPDACAALAEFRKRGGKVVLITNAPRPADAVQRMLRRLHVADDVYDAIVSSGDLTRGYIAEHRAEHVFHIGPERDHSLFDGFGVAFGDVEDADYIVCSGLFDDETETAEDYRATLTRARERDLFFVCANPDIVVERGEKLVFCAGALAELYTTLGGKVLFAGKPHPPIYQRALALAAEAGAASLSPARVLAIGDSVRTDLEGANGSGFRCLFVTSGIHAAELGERGNPDAASVAKLFKGASKPPIAVTPKLMW
ncbi:TIGR01459 family HAD-type hydrolase [Bradyrhizobium sp. LHD-71]|uniref:TIGR01459 family HAD-type hydrolase n=1 Tax=Bradyrhizobium sp. LHD-71 TaxID=3072141 RepID=UPI00280EDD62|nr:TIGR01459 family HAD-type hydrolase [Bradyrhizobium sp. LHD-71]MDQ8726758.1 TIGR01459 family HAD-type hydrolase [Bradyrhizobium sp. LHD-71]